LSLFSKWVPTLLLGIPRWVTSFNLLLIRCYPQLSQEMFL
jgi:hypothetical protein